MALALTVLTPAGTMPSGRERLKSEIFYISASDSTDGVVAKLLGCTDEYLALNNTVIALEIDPKTLHGLFINVTTNVVNDEDFSAVKYGIDEIAKAQKAAKTRDARVMLTATF